MKGSEEAREIRARHRKSGRIGVLGYLKQSSSRHGH